MVRVLPDQKAHTNKKKGTEPLGHQVKDKTITMEVKSTPTRKKLLKELPVGALPKIESPISDKEWEENNVKMLLEFEEKLKRQHPPELTSRVPTFSKRHQHWVPNSPEQPPTWGESGVETQYGKNLRGIWGGMFLFSIFLTFIVSWSPGMTLLWVTILTLFLLTLSECRTQARITFKEGLVKLVTFTGNKLGLKYLDDIQGGGT
jgi:hypothetical protein